MRDYNEVMKPESDHKSEQSEPFQRFDQLFRAVISVPKTEIDKQDEKWKEEKERGSANKPTS